MPVERLAVYTTVYPAVRRFLGSWRDSVLGQTDRDFDLWIGVDQVPVDQIAAELDSLDRIQWCVSKPGDSPAAIRGAAIQRIVDSYDAVVFVDSDDLLAPSRVAAARAALGETDVVACALRIIDEAGADRGHVFGPGDEDPRALIPRYNVFGLSNTAYRTRMLRRCLPVPVDCVLLDWLLATRAWAGGASMRFDSTPRMCYRQYGANTARVVGPFTPQDVRSAAELVVLHYRLVLASWDTGWSDTLVTLRQAQERAERFLAAITDSPEALERYTSALNTLPPRYVWWWCVAHPELETIWNA